MKSDFQRPEPQIPEKKFWYVYILCCADNKPYTGYTKNLSDRLLRHKRGSVPATKLRRPLDLETYFAFTD